MSKPTVQPCASAAAVLPPAAATLVARSVTWPVIVRPLVSPLPVLAPDREDPDPSLVAVVVADMLAVVDFAGVTMSPTTAPPRATSAVVPTTMLATVRLKP